ncbi:hypothetical protein PV682_12315 [Streptomyces niveiscabiei]|uniref:hypothetical protein n=1 Tax=Streptomyces niveiscabiei TaxID=164115 RepID=UPI0029B1B7D7|nr:hypothetical protein [Streptomyces niveiscabiei]MDX3382236.1 hypothetical protein [Streptomyces niveiscabiei]
MKLTPRTAKTLAGESVTYNGQVHTCLNGPYQQEHSLEILAEVAARYPIDGVFINMHGYQVRDYSRTYHGICQCANRARRFGEARLPRSEDDPLYPSYEDFKTRTDGTMTTLGGDSPQQPGYDLLGAFTGSEGTLGVVTRSRDDGEADL